MKDQNRRQGCILKNAPVATSNQTMKYVTMVVFEEEGKTVLQPFATDQESQTLHDLFQSKTLEVWLPNGKSNEAEFDVSILSYSPRLQPPTKCSKEKSRICLKNHVDTIVSCEQCPIATNEVKD